VVAVVLPLVDGGSVHARRAAPQPLSAAAVEQAACSDATWVKRPRAAMLKAEVLLDRLDLSPGVVDGKNSENAGKAIVTFQRSRGLAASGKLDQATWDKLCESTSVPVLIAYTITEDDVRGPFVHRIPRDFEGMARLPRLGYRRETADKIHAAASDFASERRKDIDATVSRMRAEAAAAQDKLQKLAGAGTESWSALSAALAETRAVFDLANQTAREAFKRATGSAQ